MQPQSPKQFARWLEGFSQRLVREVSVGMERSLRADYRLAQQLSRGKLTSAWLARNGHPYGKGFVGPLSQPLYIINDQGGAFAGAWHKQEPYSETATGDVVTRLINDDPHAAWLDEGTKWMVARHFSEAIIEQNAPNRQHEIEAAIDRSLPK